MIILINTSNIMTDTFDDKFEKFKNLEGKYESMYIFVANNIIVELFIEKVKKMIGIIEEIQNSSKRNHLKTILSNFCNFLIQIQNGTHINGIFMVNNNINEIPFDKYWTETLNLFDCGELMINYGDKFNLVWLKNLLLDRTYIHVLHLKGNALKHIHLNTTKKRVQEEKEQKGMSVQTYINENIPKTELCIVHGISSLIKGIDENYRIKILNGHQKDSDIESEYEKLINSQNAILLQQWLDKILDPKDGQKLVFGKDISKCIELRTLKTMFCSPEMKKKIYEKIPSDNLNFEIIEVKSFGEDVGKRLRDEFKGGVGVKYY